MENNNNKNRFKLLSNQDLLNLADECDSKNTKRSTCTWLNAYRNWAAEREENPKLEEYSPKDLDVVLSRFYGELRKRDGTEYEPDCLRVMQAGLHRYLIEKKYPKSILTDLEFTNSNKTLKGKARQLRRYGKGKRPNASEPLTPEDEDELWEKGKLGTNNPVSLVHTMWYINTQHFGQRGQEANASMTMENFQKKTDEASGLQYIEFFEDSTKTRQRSSRVTNSKMFEVKGSNRCPVRMFNFYISKRPKNLRETGRFYLSPKRSFVENDAWFTNIPVGKNKIAFFMKEISEGTSIEGSGKKVTNHSGHKTLVKKINTTETSIIDLTGHNTTKGLKNCDPGDHHKTLVKKMNIPEASIIDVTGLNTTEGLKSYDRGDHHKPLVKKMNIPETSIIDVTGHNTTEGLKSYDPGNHHQEFNQMSSYAIAHPTASTPSTIPSCSTSSGPSRFSNPPGHVFNTRNETFNSTIQKVGTRKRKYLIYRSKYSQSQ